MSSLVREKPIRFPGAAVWLLVEVAVLPGQKIEAGNEICELGIMLCGRRSAFFPGVNVL